MYKIDKKFKPKLPITKGFGKICCSVIDLTEFEEYFMDVAFDFDVNDKCYK